MKTIIITLILGIFSWTAQGRCGSVVYEVQGSIVDDKSGKPIKNISVGIFPGMSGSAKISETDQLGNYKVSQRYSVLGKYVEGVGDKCDFKVEHIDVNVYHREYGAYRFRFYTEDLKQLKNAKYSYWIPVIRIIK